ncbi:unnamed protein product [Caenorhabditis brenneri]
MSGDAQKIKTPRKASLWIRFLKLFRRKRTRENEQIEFIPFQILRLPLLALVDCIQSMKFFTLLKLSQSSKRVERLVTISTRNKIGIRLEFSHRSSLTLTDLNLTERDWVLNDSLGGEKNRIRILNRTFYAVFIEESSRLKLEGLEKDIIELAEHLSLIFGSPVRSFVIKLYGIQSLYIFEWLKNHQPSIDYLIVNKTLFINVLPFPLFKCRQMIRAPKIIIFESRWVKLNTVDYMESSVICLENSSLSPKDLNLIMKNFMIGWNRNLEYFEVVRNVEEGEDPNSVFETLTKDLKYKKHEQDDRRPKTVTLQPDFEIELTDNFDLLKRDKTIATFCHCYQPHRRIDNVITHVFYLHAWKK